MSTPAITPVSLYALLIGIDFYLPNQLSDGTKYSNLGGAVRDVNHVEAFLRERFQIPETNLLKLTSSVHPTIAGQSIEPPEQLPTYQNIVAQFKKLLTIVPVGSQVYIHYSGHGGRSQTIFPELKGGVTGIDESLVPMNIGELDGQYLRDVELGKLLKDLVDRGLLVTLVLDSCHSGGATRGDDVAIRGLETIDRTVRSTVSLVASSAELEENWRSLTQVTRGLQSGWLPESKDYVLFAACRPHEYAYEYAFNRETKERNGALTYWLLDTLRQQNPGMTYKDVFDRIHAKIHTQFPQQTPMLMGEGFREIFGTNSISVQHSISVLNADLSLNPPKIIIAAGQASGLAKGAEFAIYRRGTDLGNAENRVAIATLTERGATESGCTVQPIAGKDLQIEAGDQAVLISASVNLVRAMTIEAEVPGHYAIELEQLIQALDGNGWIELADDETDISYRVVITESGAYQICDRTGAPFQNMGSTIQVGTINAARTIVKRLVHLAKYHAIVELENFDKESPMLNKLSVEWLGTSAVFEVGDPIPKKTKLKPIQDQSNPIVSPEDGFIFLAIRNNYTTPLNLVVFNLDSNWSILQYYPSHPAESFFTLDPEKIQVIPIALRLDQNQTHTEEGIKVFASLGSANFRWLEMPALGEPLITKATRSGTPLDTLFAAIASEQPATRKLTVAASPSREWTTRQIMLTIQQSAPIEMTRSAPITPPNSASIVPAMNQFGFRLLAELIAANPGQNVFISGMSISIALSMLYNAAQHQAKASLELLLGIQGMTLQHLNASNAALQKIGQNLDPEVQLAIANSIWVKEGFELAQDFTQRLEHYYLAKVATVNFPDPIAAYTINQWVVEKTQNKIQELVSPKDIETALVVLVNAIYFKGSWKYTFPKMNTRANLFHLQDGRSKQHPMMFQRGTFNYMETDLFQAISLPYSNGDLTMDIVLPKRGRSVVELQQAITWENCQSWVSAFRPIEGNITLPRFRVEYGCNLLPVLEAIVGGPMIDNFEGMGMGDLEISQVIHKTFLEVNEEGAEAAAATAVIVTRGMSLSFDMNIDRPFFCAIRDGKTEAILFMGFIMDPQ